MNAKKIIEQIGGVKFVAYVLVMAMVLACAKWQINLEPYRDMIVTVTGLFFGANVANTVSSMFKRAPVQTEVPK